ncbi:MAG TPA: hypothetical protein VGG85_18355 [Terracidiphilus sp.]|jgi:hypothetical protein
MSFNGELKHQAETDRDEPSAGYESADGPDQDPQLQAALRDFRLTVHAWSEAAYARPRQVSKRAQAKAWWVALAWTLGCVVAVGTAGGGYLEHHHRQEVARVAAQREAEHQRQLAEQRAREAEEELARVDSAIARQVPNAMEPLAQLMNEDESQ